MSEILTKKQLEEYAQCHNTDCEGCGMVDFTGMDNCVQKPALAALAFRAMLERHVWQKRSSDGKYFCIECRNLKENGHSSICELAAMLKE